MSRKTHQKFLEKRALRAAQKAFRTRKRDDVSMTDFLSLRIQTVELWKRLLVMMPGLGLIMGGVYGYFSGWPEYGGIILGAIGLLFFVVGLLGRKKTVEAALNVGADAIFQGIIDGLF